MRIPAVFVVLCGIALAGCLSGGTGTGPQAPANGTEGPDDPDTTPPEAEDPRNDTDGEGSGSGARIETETINETLGGAGVHLLTPVHSVSGCIGGTCSVSGSANLTGNVTGVVVELAWDPANALTQTFNLRLTWRSRDGNRIQERTSGGSPLKMTLEDLSDVDRSSPGWGTAWPDQATTDNAAVYVAQGQPVTMYVSTFYDTPVDPNFSAIPE